MNNTTFGGFSSGCYSVALPVGSGRGIPDSQATGLDFFQFVNVYIPTTTNGHIQCRVVSVQNTSANAKAGLMIRENLYADSRFAMVDVQSTAGTEFVRRTSTGSAATTSTGTGTPPRWVRLARTNNTFTAWSSTNDSTWTQIGAAAASTMSSGAHVGLVVCSGDNGLLCTSVLDNVTATFLPSNTAPTLAPISNQTVNVGQIVAASADAADAGSPPPVLTFSLLNAPANASLSKIGSTNAAFNWRPHVGNADTTNTVRLKVADNASPSLSATQSLLVTVNPLTQPAITAPGWSNGQFNLVVGPPLP
jgi:hypothetical protein